MNWRVEFDPWLLGVITAIFCLTIAPADAHQRSQSWSVWQQQATSLTATFTAPAREVTRLSRPSAAMSQAALYAAHLEDTISVSNCLPDTVTRLAAQDGYVRARLTFSCTDLPGPVSIQSFLSVAQGHSHFARVEDIKAPKEVLFTNNRPLHDLFTRTRSTGGSWSLAIAYFWEGLAHIAGGIDHLAFLLALVLLVKNLRPLVWLVTGFTLGHGFSIILAMTGYAMADPGLVETAIAATILLAAIDGQPMTPRQFLLAGGAVAAVLLALAVGGTAPAFWTGLGLFGLSALVLARHHPKMAARIRPVITLFFGLIHGFGFASALSGPDILNSTSLVPVLAGFNLGIEVGQIAFVLMAWGLMTLVARSGNNSRIIPVTIFTRAALAGLAMYWIGLRGIAPALLT